MVYPLLVLINPTLVVCARSETDLVDVDIRVQKGLISPYIAFNPLAVAYIKCARAPRCSSLPSVKCSQLQTWPALAVSFA